MGNAAERFYERSHELNKKLGKSQSTLSVSELLANMRRPEDRYYSVVSYLESNPGKEVVELGFGDPKIPSSLAPFCSKYHIIDIVDRREGLSLPANISFSKSDLNEDFQLPDQSFDCVVAMMIIEHLFDPFHSFQEVFRITRPGGKMFINLPNIASIRCRLQLLRGEVPVTSTGDWFSRKEWDGNHLHNFTVGEVVRLAELTGMKLDKIYPVGGSLWLKKLKPSLMCHEVSYMFSRPE